MWSVAAFKKLNFKASTNIIIIIIIMHLLQTQSGLQPPKCCHVKRL